MEQFALEKVQKRDGRIQPFDETKITTAISKAFAAAGKPDIGLSTNLADHVTIQLTEMYSGRIPRVEEIQDAVERVLMTQGYPEVAKAYILYRRDRAEIRALKQFIGVKDDLKVSVNSANVLKRRYLLKNEKGEIIETPGQMFSRIANAVARPDAIYDPSTDLSKTADEFYSAMSSFELLPNSPALMNAGTEVGQLAACFVLPVDDSIQSIFETLKETAIIHQSGGGTGFSFSRLRPKGDIVRSTSGIASGLVSFMTIYDAATDVVKQGGRRRGANMGILRVDHPDIIDFITSKTDSNKLSNFNISVGITDAFMDAVKNDSEYELINPRSGKVVKSISAREVFDLIITIAWQTGDPGLAFLDEINRSNPTPSIGEIESTNPCGEVPLLPYESCNLASINLGKIVEETKLNFNRLKQLVHTGVHFLDNVIDETRYPIKQIEDMTRHGNRKIGLGVMGFADMLIEMGIPYDSDEAVEAGEKVMKFILEEAREASIELAKQRGVFPNYDRSIWKEQNLPLRNATVTSIAPTGTISIIASCSSGIEPLFGIAYVREILEGTRLMEVNPAFEKIAKQRGFYSRDLMMEIAKSGGIQDMDALPDEIKRIFVTSLDIAPQWHVKMQAAFQRHCDNAVAKTVNLPQEATPDDIRRVYLMAYDMKCKGITVFRYGSKQQQVLYVGSKLEDELRKSEHVIVDTEYDGSCPTGTCAF